MKNQKSFKMYHKKYKLKVLVVVAVLSAVVPLFIAPGLSFLLCCFAAAPGAFDPGVI
jgi:hypothetical protein